MKNSRSSSDEAPVVAELPAAPEVLVDGYAAAAPVVFPFASVVAVAVLDVLAVVLVLLVVDVVDFVEAAVLVLVVDAVLALGFGMLFSRALLTTNFLFKSS